MTTLTDSTASYSVRRGWRISAGTVGLRQELLRELSSPGRFKGRAYGETGSIARGQGLSDPCGKERCHGCSQGDRHHCRSLWAHLFRTAEQGNLHIPYAIILFLKWQSI